MRVCIFTEADTMKILRLAISIVFLASLADAEVTFKIKPKDLQRDLDLLASYPEDEFLKGYIEFGDTVTLEVNREDVNGEAYLVVAGSFTQRLPILWFWYVTFHQMYYNPRTKTFHRNTPEGYLKGLSGGIATVALDFLERKPLDKPYVLIKYLYLKDIYKIAKNFCASNEDCVAPGEYLVIPQVEDGNYFMFARGSPKEVSNYLDVNLVSPHGGSIVQGMRTLTTTETKLVIKGARKVPLQCNQNSKETYFKNAQGTLFVRTEIFGFYDNSSVRWFHEKDIMKVQEKIKTGNTLPKSFFTKLCSKVRLAKRYDQRGEMKPNWVFFPLEGHILKKSINQGSNGEIYPIIVEFYNTGNSEGFFQYGDNQGPVIYLAGELLDEMFLLDYSGGIHTIDNEITLMLRRTQVSGNNKRHRRPSNNKRIL